MLVHGRELEAFAKQPRRAALLALLAVEQDCARERALDLIWGERDPERARRALNQTVYELRRQLGEQAIEVRGERLVAAGVGTDLAIFQQAAGNGDRGAALEVYRGPFLDGIFLSGTHELEEWSARHRSRLARLHRKLRLEYIDELRRAGRTAAALTLAARAADEDPTDDDYQHRCIELLIESGQRAQAVRAYDAFAARLAGQNLEPLEHTRELIGQLGAAPAATSRPAAPESPAPPEPVTTGPAAPTPPAAIASVSGRRRPPRAGVLPLAVAGVLVTLVGIGLLRSRAQPATATQTQRLAVLPFEDQSAGRGHAHVALGIGDALTTELQARLPDVAVLSREAAGRLRAAPPDSIARALGPALLISGTFVRVADSVRLNVQVVDAATQTVVRALEAREPWTDELRVLDALVLRVLESVRPVLGDRLREREVRTGTGNAAAFALYLRAAGSADAGQRLAEARDWHGAEHLLMIADSLLAEAERLDARWPRPSQLRAEYREHRALLLLLSGRVADTATLRAHMSAALEHADEAVRRDPEAAAGRALRGMLRSRWTSYSLGTPLEQRSAWLESAAADLRAGLSLEPRRPEVWLQLAEVYYRQGEFTQALSAARNAERFDAYGSHTATLLERLATYAFESGEDEAARQWCSEGARRFPDDVRYMFCRSLLLAAAPVPRLDSLAAIARAGERFPRTSGFPVVLELNYALGLARAGHHDRAEAQIAASRAAGYSAEALWREAAVRTAMRQPAAALALLTEYERNNLEPQPVRWSRLLQPLRGAGDAPARPGLNPSR